jgi:hypothetical protein
MPIYTSRFSAERSLVGKFVTSRPPETEDAESREKTRRKDNAQSRASQQAPADRLEISNRQQAKFAATLVRSSEQPAETRAENNVADQQTTRQLALRKASQEAVVARSNLLSSTEENILPIRPSAPESAQSPSNTQQTTLTQENFNALQSALTNRLDALVEQLSDIRTEQSVEANQQENTIAAQSAAPEPLVALAEATADVATPAATPITEDDVAVEVEAQLEAQIDQLRDTRLELISTFVPPEPPAREEQQAELRSDLQTISSGLQADAAIENQRTVEETERNTEVAIEREQRDTVRSNEREISTLQTSRRRLDQEAQRTDQAIRQLQSETARLKNGAPSSGTSVNILAQ